MISQMKEYLQIRYEIEKLRLVEKISGSGATVVSGTVIAIVMCIALVFLSLAFAWYLSSCLKSVILGFTVVGCIYLVIAVLLFLFHKKIMSNRFRDKIID